MKSKTAPGIERTALYRFFDEDGRLLYVGISCQLARRISSHELEKTWWAEVAHITVTHFPLRQQAIEAEVAVIQAERPRYNIVHLLPEDATEGAPVARPREVSA